MNIDSNSTLESNEIYNESENENENEKLNIKRAPRLKWKI